MPDATTPASTPTITPPTTPTQPPTPSAHEASADPELAAEPIDVGGPIEEQLIEEISIDGMCGVY